MPVDHSLVPVVRASVVIVRTETSGPSQGIKVVRLVVGRYNYRMFVGKVTLAILAFFIPHFDVIGNLEVCLCSYHFVGMPIVVPCGNIEHRRRLCERKTCAAF